MYPYVGKETRMKIENSTVALESSRGFSKSSFVEAMTLETRDGTALIDGIKRKAAEKDSMLVDGMRDLEKERKMHEKEQRQKNMQATLEYLDRTRQANTEPCAWEEIDEDLQIRLLRSLLAALRGEKGLSIEDIARLKDRTTIDLRSSSLKRIENRFFAGARELAVSASEGRPVSIGTTPFGTTWHRITAVSGYRSESEYTSFASTGLVTTTDGRQISFGVEVNMSRSFTEKLDYLEDVEYIKTDPLMINLSSNVGSVSDMKFKFDLDGDGRKDNISFAGDGSGFLALDKNSNGVIDDGSELFGTRSGDGFADLAEYDDDGNGWIDENDGIFAKLRVWTKDGDGNDRLLDLKQADVGAIYLSAADTEFSLNDDANRTNGVIQKTGIYLKESGGVGTVNHVDLVL